MVGRLTGERLSAAMISRRLGAYRDTILTFCRLHQNRLQAKSGRPKKREPIPRTIRHVAPPFSPALRAVSARADTGENLTSRLMGDPSPGRSALDQKQSRNSTAAARRGEGDGTLAEPALPEPVTSAVPPRAPGVPA